MMVNNDCWSRRMSCWRMHPIRIGVKSSDRHRRRTNFLLGNGFVHGYIELVAVIDVHSQGGKYPLLGGLKVGGRRGKSKGPS